MMVPISERKAARSGTVDDGQHLFFGVRRNLVRLRDGRAAQASSSSCMICGSISSFLIHLGFGGSEQLAHEATNAFEQSLQRVAVADQSATVFHSPVEPRLLGCIGEAEAQFRREHPFHDH
ncbi:hypothetical protein [Bradyrhizobium zhanjiangense]|uniref:Uncharacterized protein n=1 Tax=Bradyrhizobium zhanjiangense TaxID=1325107 RepID=A0A4Q0SLG9_9BRAD|nr:hypothetical protein [Bradyrhizobium zhanjiangense]RXH40397.1 hypothetical protein XH94_13285 [Bradyrhizobium zhanjiangense]